MWLTDCRLDTPVQCMVTEGDLTLGGGHTMRYTNDVPQNCRSETCHQKGPGMEVGLPQHGLQCWVLDFVQEIFHDMSPGDFESTFFTVGDSETKEGLQIEGARSLPRE